jgi:DNA-binding protein YbaB
VEMLEDLIVAAVNEANSRVDELTGSEMGKLTEGISMPDIPGLS